MRNFTVVDTIGTSEACLALLPFMFAPGYVAGWALNLFEFRQRRPILRLILALPLSIAICPMLSYLLARFFEPGLWALYIALFAAGTLIFVKDIRRARAFSLSNYTRIALGLVVLWVVVSIASLVDIQIGNKLYPPIAAYDHSVRSAMTIAIARHVPPTNPFFANSGALMRYHYLWLLFCSLPMKVLRLPPRCVVYAGVVWCGIALMCVVALGLKFLLQIQTQIERKTVLGIALLAITGLDILPTLALAFKYHFWVADMEWWNDVQITSWADTMLWVPHHLAALLACFLGFLLLRHYADKNTKWPAAPVIVVGMAFASASGMSVYVTFTFAVAIAMWLLVLVARKDWREIALFASAGAIALLWALPFLSSLRGPGTGNAFIELAIRPFPLGLLVLRQNGIVLHSELSVALANALLLPINYGLELGFFLAVLILRLRQLARSAIQPTPNELASWTLVATSFLIGTFLRSSTIVSNDLGWRCFLPAQLILLVWGVPLIHDWWFADSSATPQASPRPWLRATLASLLLLGLCGTAYEVSMLRVYPLLADQGVITHGSSWIDMDRHFGERAYAMRSGYETLDAQLPPTAVLQHDLSVRDLILHMLYSGRDVAAGSEGCEADFGGDADVCAERVQNLKPLFHLSDDRTLDPVCQKYGIAAIVVADLDPVWRDRSSWAWRRQPLVANNYIRAFRCGVADNTAK